LFVGAQFGKRVGAIVQCADIVRLDGKRRVKPCQRLAMLAERNERQAEIVERIRAPRFDLECGPIARAGIVVASERTQGVAAIVERVGILRLCEQRRVAALQRLVRPLECQQRYAAVAQHFGMILLESESRIVGGERILRAT
jgi:hypothetical protein